MIRTLTLTLLAAAPGLPLLAQQAVTLPPGCAAWVTIEDRSCRLRHLIRCEGEPTGQFHDVIFQNDELAFVGLSNDEAEWLYSYYAGDDASEVIEAAPADRISLTELLDTGADSYDLTMSSEFYGDTRYVGEDRIVDGSMTISGIELPFADYEFEAFGSDGQLLWRAEGRQVVSPDWRIFMALDYRWTYPDGSVDRFDDTPVAFHMPGDERFLMSSVADCTPPELASGTEAAAEEMPAEEAPVAEAEAPEAPAAEADAEAEGAPGETAPEPEPSPEPTEVPAPEPTEAPDLQEDTAEPGTDDTAPQPEATE